MKPSEKCKAAGLKSLAELVQLTGIPERTLLDRANNSPAQFDDLIRAAVVKRLERAIAGWEGVGSGS